MPKDSLPLHVAIIMDGNGRWAASRGLPRLEGHRRGVEKAKEIIRASNEIGIKYLTLYAFSMENWQRPEVEVFTLMKLLELYLRRELGEMIKDNVSFKCIGETRKLPTNVQAVIRDVERQTADNTGLKLIAALSYGGRNEILRAVKKAIAAGAKPDDITEEAFSSLLDTAGVPPPDLIIRTSGERRLSNFLLWQAAYSEFYFTSTLWPDFTRDEYMNALRDFQGRERRFGAVSAKV